LKSPKSNPEMNNSKKFNFSTFQAHTDLKEFECTVLFMKRLLQLHQTDTTMEFVALLH
jgi:hypothetical protein